MITSQKITKLYKPLQGEEIPASTLVYFAGRNRLRAHEFVLKRFRESGIKKAELARRLGRRPEIINRLLGAPGNWGLDTLSYLLFAIDGAEPEYGINDPLAAPPRNDVRPAYLDSEVEIEKKPELIRQMAAEERMNKIGTTGYPIME